MTDKRRTAARPDLAADHLKGLVMAERYVAAEPHRVTRPATVLRRQAAHESAIETELLYGETFNLYELKEGWAWGQADIDGYVGYVEAAALSPLKAPSSHRVSALRSYLYTEPDLKSPPRALLSMGSRLTVTGTQGRFSQTDDGFIFTGHLCPMDHVEDDWVALAQSFMGTPYLWGGRTSLGLDCSSLVQLALQQKGLAVPRDSDQQMEEIGSPVDIEELTRGDLVFWKGHVAIMIDKIHMVHANATAMAVSCDQLSAFAAKIEAAEGPVLGCRRLK
ncbi:MAG: peptidase P60 [Alphaproteobacteria bacterium]|nr:MAG: peptidase P60 [Alphaproteobacteria bacterium]